MCAWSSHGSECAFLRVADCGDLVSVEVGVAGACLALLASSACRRYSLWGSTRSEFGLEVGVDGVCEAPRADRREVGVDMLKSLCLESGMRCQKVETVAIGSRNCLIRQA